MIGIYVGVLMKGWHNYQYDRGCLNVKLPSNIVDNYTKYTLG